MKYFRSHRIISGWQKKGSDGFEVTPTPATSHNLAETCRLESYAASSGQGISTHTTPLPQSDFGMLNPVHVQANYVNYATVANSHVAQMRKSFLPYEGRSRALC